MLASLSLLVLAAAATPCEMLDALSTPQVSIKAAAARRSRRLCRRIAVCGSC
jgi:hypothetical protein